DPGAMRAFAFDVGNVADRLGALARTTHTGAFAFTWDGPAALRFRDNVVEATNGATIVAGKLKDLSTYLVQQATILEQKQEDARRQIAAEQRLVQAKERTMRP